MYRSRVRNAVLGAAGAALLLGLSGHAASAELVPHRAIYSLTLGKADSSGQFLSVDGVVTTVLEKTCEAWMTAERVEMRIDTQAGGHLLQDLKYAGWESLDGKRYRFVAHTRTNGESKSFKGTAHADPDRPGKAVYAAPKKMTMELPPGTRFYFGLTSWLIERARAGVKRAETVVFDGTDEEGPQRAVAFIIPRTKGADEAERALGPLLDRPGWIIRLAFYPMDSRALEPDYEVEAVVLDNGVTPKLEMVFTGFTAVQTLEKIEALELPDC